MATGDEVINVIVRSIAGEVILGPKRFVRATAVGDLREELIEQHPATTGLTRVVLLRDGDVLDDCSTLDAGDFECTAVFSIENLLTEEREKCMDQLHEKWLSAYPHLRHPGGRRLHFSGRRFVEGVRPAISDRIRVDVASCFSSFPDVARIDGEVIQEAVSLSWRSLQFVDSKACSRSLVLKACLQSADALTLIPPESELESELLCDTKFMLQLVRLHGPQAVADVVPKLFGDKDFVLQAVRFAPRALLPASLTLFDDRTFLNDAVARNKLAIGCVPAAAELDQDVLMRWIEDASELPMERSEVLRKVARDGMWLANAVEFQNDQEIVWAAVQQNPWALRFTTLTGDRDVVLAAVQEDGMMLEFAADDLRGDHEVVCVAIRNNPRARRFAIDKPLFDVSDVGCEESLGAGKPHRSKPKVQQANRSKHRSRRRQ